MNPQMEALGNNICFGSSLLITAAAAENVLLNKKNNFFSYNHVLVSKNSSPRLRKICCGLSDIEIGENPRSRILTKPKINKMDEYNIAMKRMMRNPYEYHHDLGLSLLLRISFQQVLSFTFYWIFQFLFLFFLFLSFMTPFQHNSVYFFLFLLPFFKIFLEWIWIRMCSF